MKQRNKSKAYKLVIEIVLVIGFAGAYAIPFVAISMMNKSHRWRDGFKYL